MIRVPCTYTSYTYLMNTLRANVQSISLLSLFLAAAAVASAHATVSPAEAPAASYETFTLSVPTEKDVPTTAVRMIVPAEVTYISPVVKPGWKIQLQKEGERITEISWTGGSIPAEQKDLFQFTARTPEEGSTLIWKIYQTYGDGTIVAWDQESPEGGDHDSVQYPYSTTEVGAAEEHRGGKHRGDEDGLPIALSIMALAVSLAALWLAWKRPTA